MSYLAARGAMSTNAYARAGRWVDPAENGSPVEASCSIGRSPGWNTSGRGATSSLTRVAGARFGGWAALCTNTCTTASTCLLNNSPSWVSKTSAGTYTRTLWVRSDTKGADLNLSVSHHDTTLVATTSTPNQAHDLVVAGHGRSPSGLSRSTLDFNACGPSAAAGSSFYADDATVYLGS